MRSYRRAITDGPEFVESETDYPTLLGQTGWIIVDHQDVTQGYVASCRRQLEADDEYKLALRSLIGASGLAERQADWRARP